MKLFKPELIIWLGAALCVVSSQTPPDVDSPRFIYILEDTKPGVLVGNITAVDQGGGRIDVTTSSEQTSDTVYLTRLSQTEWGIILNRTLDYEAEHRLTLSFMVKWQDELPILITVYVKDVNDVAPKFLHVPYKASVRENDTIGTVVFSDVKTDDPDEGPGGSVIYTLQYDAPGSSDTESKFQINAYNGTVTLNGTLDYETTNIYHYYIFAFDQGPTPLNSSTDLYISVLDIQDTPPYFRNLPYIADVDENTKQNTPVITVDARDGDTSVSDRIVYNITQTNCENMFDINSNTGVISVGSVMFDRDAGTLSKANGLCILTVQATEKDDNPPQLGNDTAVQNVTITVHDVNDNRPEFPNTIFSASIPENSQAGTPLSLNNNEQIYVVDKDQGANAEITVNLTDVTNTFELVSTSLRSSGTLSIRVKDPRRLDFETRQSTIISITASDSGGPASNTAVITVNITNVNEFTPNFTQASYAADVLEGTARGTSVIQITAQDFDGGNYGNVTYSLENDRNMFGIDPFKGTVSLLSSGTDRETTDTYYMLVLATDGGGRMQTAPLVVTILDENDNDPQFLTNQYEALLDEEFLSFSRPLKLQATDEDQPGTDNSNISFAINASDPRGLVNHFNLDPVSGVLTVKTELDYDTLNFTSGKQGKILLNVTASDHGNPKRVTTATVEITLNDINDNKPVFQKTAYSGSILEGNNTGSDIVIVTATDHDGSRPNNALLYSIESGGQDRFRINSTTGAITVSAPLDREGRSKYNLVVVVRDQAPVPQSASTTVVVTVNDVNDEKPAFEIRSVAIEKNEQFRGELYTMLATDPDLNPRLKYSIVWNNSSGQDRNLQSVSNLQSWIGIDPVNGILRILKPLDRSLVSKFEMHVMVEDLNAAADSKTQTDTGVITITVLDINDHAPVFSPTSQIKASVRENLGSDTALTFDKSLSVSDDDEGLNSKFSLTLSGLYNEYFDVFPDTVQSSADVVLRVKNNTILDYETLKQINLTITAMETDTVEHKTSTVNVQMDIQDENDHSPDFNGAVYDKTIPENSLSGLPVVTIKATDRDGSTKFNTITYSLQGADSRFTINETTGEVFLAVNDMDYDTLPNVYQMTVEASDDGNRKDSTLLTVHLSDVNDLAPDFTLQTYHATLKENSLTFDVPLEVLAVDHDEAGTPNSNVTYSITSVNPSSAAKNFQIQNSFSGLISVGTQFNFETLSSPYIQLVINATDGGSPQQHSSVKVNVTVEDVNDNPPVFPSSRGIAIAENITTETLVYGFAATDDDRSSPNNEVYYLLMSGAMDQFTINSTTGQLVTSKRLDRDVIPSYSLEVLAIDRGVPPLTGSTTLTITVTDINNKSPTIDPVITITRKEGESKLLYTFNATDQDTDHDLRYNIVWDQSTFEGKGIDSHTNLHNHFGLNPSTGELTMTKVLDREWLERADIVVTVVDMNAVTSGQTATTTLRLIVEDVDDNPPRPVPTHVTGTVKENAEKDFPVVMERLDITDDDTEKNAEFNLTLSGDFEQYFTVEPRSAWGTTVVGLRVKNNTLLDYETRDSLSFQIIATGTVNTKMRSECKVTLSITNENDFTPEFSSPEYSASIPENAAHGTSVVTVNATDGDKGHYGQITYSIVGDSSEFEINHTSGEITTKQYDFDREKTDQYFLTVMATDGGGRTRTTQIHVTLTDLNDNAPKFLQKEYSAFLRENSLNFDTDVAVKATDNDKENTSNSEIRYAVLSSTSWSSNFGIGSENGSLYVKSEVDYEQLPAQNNGIIRLTVLAEDQGFQQLTGSVNITITIQDENDKSPHFINEPYHGQVKENENSSFHIAAVHANDTDGRKPNNEVFYIITGGGNDQFQINSTTGEITTRVALDREEAASYSLQVFAVDKGSPARTASTTVTVTVLNVNDSPPGFLSPVVSMTPEEEQTSGRPVGNFSAEDKDSDALLSYAINWTASEGYDESQNKVSETLLQNAFRINNATGLVEINTRLDRETLETATLVVTVKDLHAETNDQTATGTVSIQVKDKDDHAPEFSVKGPLLANISENSPVGTPLQFDQSITVTDPDKDINSVFTLDLLFPSSPNLASCLEVVPQRARSQATVLVRVANSSCFDYETRQNIDFQIISHGEGASRDRRNVSVRLDILNVNDNPPHFANRSYSKQIHENANGLSSVLEVHATDDDRPPYDNITYSLQGGDNMFAIDSQTGVVTVVPNASLDFELRREYQLTVEATDPGLRRDSVPVTITLTDVNDNAPVFERPEYQAYVIENAIHFSHDVIVKAQDADTGKNGEVEYYIIRESDLPNNFTVGSSSGRLGLHGTLDYEELPNKTTGVLQLLVGVRDHGSSPLSSSVTVVITVKDENDNPPEFVQSNYEFSISEAAAEGDLVGDVSATDLDGSAPNNNIFYVIASGGGGKFQIDSTTGTITRAGELDSDTQNNYTLTVRAIDAGTPPQKNDTSVLININDVNDASPVFNPPTKVETVNETNGMQSGGDSGRVLATLWARDTDKDKNLTYAVVWDQSTGYGPNQESLRQAALQDAFKLDPQTSEIKVNTSVDREIMSRAVLVVNVTDTNAATNTVQTSTGTLTINIQDVNDHEPTLNNKTFTAQIAENSPAESLISFVKPDRMTVTDMDTDQNCVFSVTVEGDMANYFTADPPTARSFALVQLRVINESLLDYERHQNVTITIVAEETNTAERFSENATVLINIIDENDNDPVFDQYNPEVRVAENSGSGTPVATVQATDKDSGQFGDVTYSLEGDNDRFAIDEQTGNITTADNQTDRETKDLYLMTVVATDGGGRRTGKPLKISITDENDNAPYFDSNYTTRIKENSVDFNPPITVHARDIDEENTNNSIVTYHIVCSPSDCENFTIGEETGALHLSYPLDFEQVETVELAIEARDKGGSPLTGTATIFITVEDENDETPVFTMDTFSADVTENSKEDTYVVTLNATDDDASEPNNVVFFVLESGGSDNFRVNSTSGEITVGPGAVLDRETHSSFTLIVLALDRGDPPKSSTATVSVHLLDENDHNPEFNVTREETKIYENMTVGSAVWTMAAKDYDSDPKLVYSLLLNESQAATDRDDTVDMSEVWDWFKINKTDGTVSVKSTLDRETAEKIFLKVMVNDTNGVSLQTAEATLIITLLDVNDNKPKMSGSENLSVSEALAVRTEVTSLTASDLDRDQTVTFRMMDANSSFMISLDGKITLKNSLDRETEPSLNFTVVATDDGSPPQSTNMTITVNVTDANDNDPVFANTSYTFHVAENEPISTVVATMTASDRDEGANANVTFAFAEYVSDFQIDRITGNISIKTSLDRETRPTYTIGVVAFDNPLTEEARRAAKQINIIVTDYNDNHPTFDNIDATIGIYEGHITETEQVDTRLTNLDPGPIMCSDKDIGENANLTYLLESLDGVDYFRMDPFTGDIYVNSSLNGHGFQTYSYIVTVMDNGVPSLNATANLNITVLDQNTHFPIFVNNFSDPVLVSECLGKTGEVTTIQAEDDDRDKKTNGRVTYILTDGVSGSGDADSFHLDPNTGSLTLAKDLNREDQSEFSLLITATDHGVPPLSSTLNVLILVNDTNDNEPSFNKTDYYFSVAENDFNVVVGTVMAEDPDEYKDTSYDILGGDLADYFKIEPDDEWYGVITLTQPLDRETDGQESFSLTVTVTDNNFQPCLRTSQTQDPHILKSTTVHITVTDVNDNPPVFVSPRLVRGFMATADFRHVIFDLQKYVNDSDLPVNSEHAFYPASPLELDPGLQKIDAVKQLEKPLELTTNGTVRTNAKFPANAQGFFTWKVMANDTGGSGNVTLRIYIVGEENLIKITFFHSEDDLRQKQDQIMKDLTDMTGLEFVADDLQEVLDASGTPDPSRSALMVHAMDKNEQFKPAHELQDFLDHQIEVQNHLRKHYQVLNIQTAKEAKETSTEKVKMELILAAVIVVLVVAFLITVWVMVINMKKFKRKLKAATIETHAMAPKPENDELVPGQKASHLNPIYGKDESEMETNLDRNSSSSETSLDDNQVYSGRKQLTAAEEQEVTMQLDGEDNDAYTGSKADMLSLALAQHEMEQNGVPNGLHANGSAKVHKAARQSVMLEGMGDDLDELQATDI